MKRAIRIACLAAVLGPILGLAQNAAYNGQVTTAGFPFPTVRVCTEPASGSTCTPLASIFSDPGLTVPLQNPFTGDAAGNFTFFANTSVPYHIQITGGGIQQKDIPYVNLAGGGGGGGGGVPSVFGRTGAITAQNGDYNFTQISGTVAVGQLPSGIVFTNQSNSYTAGAAQTFVSNATNPGIVIAGQASDPTSPAPGGLWFNNSTNQVSFFDSTSTTQRFMFVSTSVAVGQLGLTTSGQMPFNNGGNFGAVGPCGAGVFLYYNATPVPACNPHVTDSGAQINFTVPVAVPQLLVTGGFQLFSPQPAANPASQTNLSSFAVGSDGNWYMDGKAAGTNDVWGQVLFASQPGAGAGTFSAISVDQLAIGTGTAKANFFTIPNCTASALAYTNQAGGGPTLTCQPTTGTGNTIALQSSPSFSGIVDLNQSSLSVQVANNASGTTVNFLVKYVVVGGAVQVVNIGTGDVAGIAGICVGNCSTTGSAKIARGGKASCVFDGATTAGDYVVASATGLSGSATAGNCHDSGILGNTNPILVGGQIIGRVATTNGGAGTYVVLMSGVDSQAAPTAESATVQPGYCYGTIGTSNGQAYPLAPFISTDSRTCTNTTAQEFPMPSACTARNLYCVAGNGGISSCTLYKGGSPTALTCAFASGTSCNDTADSVSFSAGNVYSLRVVAGQATDTLAGPRATFQCQ